MTTSPAITRLTTTLAATTTPLITANLGCRIALAYLQHGPAQAVALDFNARLITELREQGIWPDRRRQ